MINKIAEERRGKKLVVMLIYAILISVAPCIMAYHIVEKT
jgi:hypothetical protein